jgi:Double zinc ribbon
MPHQCPFCERVNPSDAKFCNACGAPLHLRPCPQCGAVNDAAATTCHECAASLSEAPKREPPPASPGAQPQRSGASSGIETPASEAEALDREATVAATLQELRELLAQTESAAAGHPPDRSAPGAVHKPAADTAKAMAQLLEAAPSYPAPAVAVAAEPRPVRGRVVLPRRGAIVTVAVLLAAVLGYFASGQHPTAEVAQTPAAAGEVKGAAPAAETGNPVSLGPRVEAAPIPSAPAAVVPTVTPGVAPSPQDPRPGTGRAPAQQVNAGATYQREGQGGATAAPAALAGQRPRAVEAGTGIERPAPPRIGPCTDAVAALGLCTPEPAQRRE